MSKKSDLCCVAWWQKHGSESYGGCLKCGNQFFISALVDHILKCWRVQK